MCDASAKIKLGAPSEFTDGEIKEFETLVLSESRVAKDSLPGVIKEAPRLVALLLDGMTIGCAAIKKPAAAYMTKVFKKSGLATEQAKYHHELGWVVVAKAHRKMGYSGQLVESALKPPYLTGVYATSQDADIGMHKTLERYGFKKFGTPYSSNESHDKNIIVFLLK
jgi:predicted GNAT family N-acyltransferase